MKTLKVLWLSRHAMSEDQVSSLSDALIKKDGVILPSSPEAIEVIPLNATYPAKGDEAARYIFDLQRGNRADVVAGVFPAHVAVELFANGIKLCIPVTKPIPAVEGEERKFEHSHWEMWIN